MSAPDLDAEVAQLRAKAVRWGFPRSRADVTEYAGKLAAWVGGPVADPFSNGVVLVTTRPAEVARRYNETHGKDGGR